MTDVTLRDHPVSTPSLDGLPPLKITVAPNGARRSPADHPQLPVSLPKIILTATQCHDAGADEIHLHVRDADGGHSLDAELYRAAIVAIQAAAPKMSIQITTESAGICDVQTQFDTLRALRPNRVSVAVREILRSPKLVAPFYDFAAEQDIQLQHILYDTDDLVALNRLIDQGIVASHMRDVLLVLGRYAPPTPAQPQDLPGFVSALDGAYPNWTVCAFGRHEQAVAEAAMQLGGHIRIGFENNIQRPDGSPAANNAENITRAVTAARALGRPLLSEAPQS